MLDSTTLDLDSASLVTPIFPALWEVFKLLEKNFLLSVLDQTAWLQLTLTTWTSALSL
jgi:hypothetical protein